MDDLEGALKPRVSVRVIYWRSVEVKDDQPVGVGRQLQEVQQAAH